MSGMTREWVVEHEGQALTLTTSRLFAGGGGTRTFERYVTGVGGVEGCSGFFVEWEFWEDGSFMGVSVWE